MKRSAFFMAFGLMLGAAASGFSGSTAIEATRQSGGEVLALADAAIPLHLEGKAARLRCTTRLRFNYGGNHNRCPYGRVVTGVQVLNGNLAILTCGEVEVTCR